MREVPHFLPKTNENGISQYGKTHRTKAWLAPKKRNNISPSLYLLDEMAVGLRRPHHPWISGL
jgi:hypothetical protein